MGLEFSPLKCSIFVHTAHLSVCAFVCAALLAWHSGFFFDNLFISAKTLILFFHRR